MDQQKTGAFIAQLRKEKGLTQRELAEALNVTDKAVSKWERGQSYPDITIISPLADTLGVTERELLQGGRGETETAELVVRDTLKYAEKAAKQHTGRVAAVLMSIYTGALLLGVFVCALCDALINKNFTWSPVVLCACALAWGVVAPFYYMKKRKIFWSAVALTVLLPLLLWVVAIMDAGSAAWFPQPAFTLAGIWMGLGWIMVLLHTFTRVNKWYIAALVIFLCAPLNWYTNAVCNGWLETGIEPFTVVVTVASGVLLFIVGTVVIWYGRKRARG